MLQHRPRTRLYVPQALRSGGTISFTREQAAYLTKVLRLKSGAEVGLFNGNDGEWCGVLDVASPRAVAAQLTSQLCAVEAETGPVLAFALIKKVALEWLVTKATELGVAALQPLVTDHSHADLGRVQRLELLVREACEQCERCRPPTLYDPQQFETWVAACPPTLAAVEAGPGGDARAWLAGRPAGVRALLIGPEGGFSARERARLAAHPNVTCLTLGPRILKAETAGLTLLTIAQLANPDFAARPAFRF